jgi:secreted trypsin-like serine protease
MRASSPSIRSTFRSDLSRLRSASPTVALLLFLGAATSRCALDSNEAVADPEVTTQIVGGSRVTSSDPAASVTASVLDPSNPDVGQYCTGIVVGRDVVLTAAHCFEDRTRAVYVRVGSASNTPIRVQQIAFHAQYDETRRKDYDALIQSAISAPAIKLPASPLYDLALLYLQSPLPSNAKVATFAAARPDLTASTLESVGFGCTSTACSAATDVLRKVAMRYVKESSAARLVVLTGAKKKRGSCFGDSGGPDFIVAGKTVSVFAMVSTGPESCEVGISVDTLLAPYLAWVSQTTQALHDGAKSSGFVVLDL